MYKVYSQKEPRVDKGEVFLLPTLTDQLADEPLDKLVARYMIAGQKLSLGPADLEIDDNTKDADIDAAFDDFATEDVAAMDRADAAEVLRQASEASAVLAEIAAKAKDEPRTSKEALESKDASTDAADVKKSQE